MGLRAISLFSGIAGLDRGVKLARPDTRTVCYVERDSFCQQVLRARMQDGSIDDARIWDDVTTFDGTEWRGQCDLITAGYPCQPWSVAGKRRGQQDERWLWPDVARIIGEVRPQFAFLENVAGHVAWDGLGSVLADLAALGFDAQWGTLRASDVGAPHPRRRLFALAYTHGTRLERLRAEYQLSESKGKKPSTWRTWWASEPRVGRVVYGFPHRARYIRALGNAVVPQQACLAFSLLWERMREATA